MIILDGSLRVQGVNPAFIKLFDLTEAPARDSRLADLPNDFWNNEEMRDTLRQVLIKNNPLRNKEHRLIKKMGEKKLLFLSSKAFFAGQIQARTCLS